MKVLAQDAHERLDVYLAEALADIPSRTFVKKLIIDGHVKVNERVVKPHHKIMEGDDVWITIPKNFLRPQYIEPEDIPLDIFYEDDHIIIVNKPCGLMVHPATGQYTGTLVNALLNHSVELSGVNEDHRPGIVHRLDQSTSGLIIVAKNNIAHTKIARQFQRHTIWKKYIALVEGHIRFDEGVIRDPLARHTRHKDKMGVCYNSTGKKAVTYYKVVRRLTGSTLVALFPRTGRTHQLRVHMSYHKHPILGDDKYGHSRSFPRLALHAQAIALQHPFSKKYIAFFSRPPREFLAHK